MNWKRIYLSLSFLLAFLGSGELLAQCVGFRAEVMPDTFLCPVQHVNAYPIGGQGPYTYQWSTGATTFSVSTPTTGFYSVTIQDANGCVAVDSINVNNLTVTGSVVDARCGIDNGQIQLTVLGSNNYSVNWYDANWSLVDSSMSLNNIPAGSYTVEVYDYVSRCTEYQTFVVGGSTSPTVMIDPDTTNCPVNTLFANVFGGTAPYTYHWSNGTNNSTISNLAAAQNYTLSVIDANGCSDTTNYYIDTVCNQQQPCNISIFMAEDSINCPSSWVHAMPSGGISPYTYTWSDGQTTASISGLISGMNYMLTVTDATGCTASTSYYVDSTNCNQQQPCNISIFMAEDSINCPSSWVHAMPSGGISPYTYTWSDGQTTASISGLISGMNYMLTVTDATGCTASTSYYVDSTNCNQQQPCNISIFMAEDSINCPSSWVHAMPSGGISPYTYTWSDGQTTASISGLISGMNYMLTVTDATGCTASTSYYVDSTNCNQQQPCNIQTAVYPDTTNCPANAFYAQVSGDSNLIYFWSGSTSNTTYSGALAAGQHYFAAYNQNTGCIDTTFFYVDSVCNNQPVCNMQAYAYSQGCPADTLSAYAWNGAAPYTYSWSTGLTVTTQSNRHDAFASNGVGQYSVTITDANGCTAVSSVQVNSQTPMQVSYNISDADCGQNNGAIDLTVTGGDSMYMYNWSNNNWQEDQTNLAPGFYSVYVYDSSGCSVYLDSLIVNGGGTINPSITPAICADSLGAIELNPTGFTNPQFVWNNGATSPSLYNLSSGVYTVTITDDSCQIARTFFLGQDSLCDIIIAGRVTDNTSGGTCTQGTSEAYRLVRLQPSGIISTTNQYGYYQFTVTQTGNYTVELLPDGVSTQLCPTSNINVNAAAVGGYYGGNDFVVTHPPVNDLRVNLVHYSTSTPGFDLYTYVYYCNDGNTTQNATITVDYDSQLEFNSTAMNPRYNNATYYSYNTAAITAHDAVNNNITFVANNLGAGECGLIRIYLTTPTTVALGNQVTNSVAITPIAGDADPANNTDVDSLTVIGSWDPNEIVLRPTRSGDPRGQAEIFTQDEVLDYTIHFQNLGTAPAYTVVVRDTLDASFDVSSLKNLQFSHPATMTVENGNILVFTFNNINLPDADSNEPGSHGFINYSIDRDPNLSVGAVIPNKAAIYFDFNAPVITNLSEAMISNPTSTHELELLNTTFKVFPNPSQGQYFVNFEQSQTQDIHLQVYNMQGQLLLDQTQADAPTSGQLSFDLSNFPAAHYLLRINGQEQLIQKQ